MIENQVIVSDIEQLQIIIMLLLVLMVMIQTKDQHMYLNEILMDHGINYKNQSQMMDQVMIVSDQVQLQIIIMLLLVLIVIILIMQLMLDQHIYLNEILMDHGINYKNQSHLKMIEQTVILSEIVYLQIIIMLLLVFLVMIQAKDQHMYLNEILMDHGIKYKK